MKKTYQMAVIGSGKIAYKISEASLVCENRINRYAVFSRNRERAVEFAKEKGFEKVYDTAEELLNDKKIDFVYIATPTEVHYEYMKACLLAGKNVLCEKTFTLNCLEAEELFSIANERNLICMDAIWSMYMPMWKKLTELAEEKALGKIYFMSASFGYPQMHISRLMNEKGGGALFDLGVYCFAAVQKILKSNYEIKESKFKFIKNVDVVNKIKMQAENCKIKIHSSIKNRDSYILWVCGMKGMIISRKFWLGKQFYWWKYPFCIKKYSYEHMQNGYEYELMEIVKLLDENKTQSSLWKQKDTLQVLRHMDDSRVYANNR